MIKPHGYLYHLNGQSDCFIGIESIPDHNNEIRFGTIFLRNFYTGLDYSQNLIMLGLNQAIGSQKYIPAEIHGSSKLPDIEDHKGAALAIVIVILLLVSVIGIGYFFREKLHKGV